MAVYLIREVMSQTGCSRYTAADYLSENGWHLAKTIARLKADLRNYE